MKENWRANGIGANNSKRPKSQVMRWKKKSLGPDQYQKTKRIYTSKKASKLLRKKTNVQVHSLRNWSAIVRPYFRLRFRSRTLKRATEVMAKMMRHRNLKRHRICRTSGKRHRRQ